MCDAEVVSGRNLEISYVKTLLCPYVLGLSEWAGMLLDAKQRARLEKARSGAAPKP